MNDYISKLLIFFNDYATELINKEIISEFNNQNINIDYLSKSKRGDVSSNFYLLIKKQIIKKEFDIKNDLIKKLSQLHITENINFSSNGFINIFFKKIYLFEGLLEILKNKESYGFINLGKNKKINLEFVSANPTGPIHIAHIRGAIIGDVISNILIKTGYKVTKEYYVNDSGTQIQILGNSLYKRYCQLFNENVNFENNEYPGEYLIKIAKMIKSADGDKWLKNIETERIKYFENYAVNSLIDEIKNDLSLLNINFDKFTYESEIINSKIINKLFSILKNKNLIYEGVLDKPKVDDIEWEPRNQLLFKSSSLFDDNDRALKKSNGDWTYFANDAAYHYNKYLRKFDKLINIWGADHIGYIPRMKSILFSINDNKNYFNVITCQIVRLIKNNKTLKMSKREDNFITLKDMYNEVGKDPLRYFMISTRNETHIDFNMDKVIEKNKDNPVFYCQYAYARVSSVLKKFDDLNISIDNNKINPEYIKYISDYEWNIILKLLSYPFTLIQISNYNEPHRLTNYLEDLSSSFHSFWNMGKEDLSLRFIDENNITKSQSKIIWLESFKIVLKNIFDIIGIESPESM